jgi:hypothetical protein
MCRDSAVAPQMPVSIGAVANTPFDDRLFLGDSKPVAPAQVEGVIASGGRIVSLIEVDAHEFSTTTPARRKLMNPLPGATGWTRLRSA